MVNKLFGAGVDPVGKIVRINNVAFQVIGVLPSQGASPTGQDHDDVVIIPLPTYHEPRSWASLEYIDGIIRRGAIRRETTTRRERQSSACCATATTCRTGRTTTSSAQHGRHARRAQAGTTQTLDAAAGGIARVSLLVGGIGIMNIMLVSVTERTREIGLRMALGARNIEVLAQFLVEAVLGTVGGVIGIVLGVLGALLGAFLLGGAPLLISMLVIFVAVLVSALVGVVAGLWPAWQTLNCRRLKRCVTSKAVGPSPDPSQGRGDWWEKARGPESPANQLE